MVTALKQGIRRFSHSSLFSACVNSIERLTGGRTNRLCVLTYHRVADPTSEPHLYQGSISATPSEFEHQIRRLQERFRFVSVEQVLDAFAGKTLLPPRSLLITFDDAYQDFADHAWPILHRYECPAVLFVPTDYPDNPDQCFWWDRLANAIYHWPAEKPFQSPAGQWQLDSPVSRETALRRTRDYIKSLEHAAAMCLVDELCQSYPLQKNQVLSWPALRELASDGVTLGAHTRTHPLLNQVSPEIAFKESVSSLRDLQTNIGKVPRILAYPSGGFSKTVVKRLRPEFDLAFTTSRGVNEIERCDPMRIRRINVSRQTSDALIRAQLLLTSRWLGVLNPVRSAV